MRVSTSFFTLLLPRGNVNGLDTVPGKEGILLLPTSHFCTEKVFHSLPLPFFSFRSKLSRGWVIKWKSSWPFHSPPPVFHYTLIPSVLICPRKWKAKSNGRRTGLLLMKRLQLNPRARIVIQF